MAFRDNLVHCWDFEEASGNRVDHIASLALVPTNTPGNATGLVGNALSLVRSSSQYLSCTCPADMTFGSDFSMAFWLYLSVLPSSLSTNYAVMTHGIIAAGSYDWYMALLTNDTLQIAFGQGFGGVLTSANAFTASAWHFVGISHSSTALRMRIDTHAWQNASVGFGSTGVSAPVTVGADASPGSYGTFLLDQLMVWDRALSDSELDTDAYNGGAGVNCVDDTGNGLLLSGQRNQLVRAA